MVDDAIRVFSIVPDSISLAELKAALLDAGYPISIGTGIAGEATEEELNSKDWDAAFVRWTAPELHDVWLVERETPGQEPEADATIAEAIERAHRISDSAGRLIVTDHLKKTRCIFVANLLPALLIDDDHPAWAALDVALRCIAEHSEGLIYALNEGFYDAEGEMLLDEAED